MSSMSVVCICNTVHYKNLAARLSSYPEPRLGHRARRRRPALGMSTKNGMSMENSGHHHYLKHSETMYFIVSLGDHFQPVFFHQYSKEAQSFTQKWLNPRSSGQSRKNASWFEQDFSFNTTEIYRTWKS